MEQTRENGRNEAENESTARMQNPQQQQSTQNNTGMARAWNVAVRIGGYPGPGAQGFGNINVNTMQYQPGDCFRAVGLRNYSGPDAQRNGNNNPNPMQFQQRQQSTQNTTEMARARHGGDIGTAQRLAHVNARLITPGQQLRTHSVAANGPEALLGGNLGAATGNRQGSLGARPSSGRRGIVHQPSCPYNNSQGFPSASLPSNNGTNNMAGGSFQHPPPQGSLSPSLNLAAFEPREPPLRNIRQPQNTGGTSGILRPTDPTTPSRRVSDRRSSSPIEASPDGQSTRERETFSPSSSRHHSAQHWNLSARQPGARARGGNDYTGLATRDPLAPLVWSSTRPVNPNLTPNAPALSTNATTGVMMTSFQAAGLTIRFNGRTLSQFSELPEARQNVATNLEERPPPLSNEQMTVRVDCKICFTQRATVVVLPCGHCVMCKWCQQQCAPTDGANSTRPADPSTRCPICRQGVREIVTVFIG